MGLDIRWPIGLMFSLIGAMLVIYGVMTGSGAEIYQRSLGINVNLCWGSLLLIFGVTMLVLAWRGSQSGPPNKPGA
jgi:xanthine/uracil permease